MLPHRGTAQAVTIACPVEAVAGFWRDPAQLSLVLGDVTSVDATGPDRYRRTRPASAAPQAAPRSGAMEAELDSAVRNLGG
ncbi:hypothetical protein [Mycobacterium servetii]|uniref:Uncharacterized protein n=1 Tax=Mycobacterium servetii TaxID=3237418 RepID=A0ABV4C2E9_9MYCO